MNKEPDWNIIQNKLVKLVGGFLNEEIAYKKVTVELELPAELLEIFEYISTETGDNLNQLISEYASRGITHQLQELINESLEEEGLKEPDKKADKTINDDVIKEFKTNTTELEQSLNQLKNMTSQLQELMKPFEGMKNG